MRTIDKYYLSLALALVVPLLWGLLAPLIKIATLSFSLNFIIFARFSIALILFYIFVLFKQKKFYLIPQNKLQTLLAGLALSANYFSFTVGIKLTGAANGGIFIKSGNLFLILLGVYYLKEKISKKELLGIILAFSGLGLFFYTRLNLKLPFQDLIIGSMTIFFSGFCWAIYCIIIRRDKENNTQESFILNIFLIGTLLSLFFIDLNEFQQIDLNKFSLLFALGVITLIGYTIIPFALKYISSPQLSLLCNLDTLCLILFIQLFGSLGIMPREEFSMLAYLGALIIFAGIVFAIWNKEP